MHFQIWQTLRITPIAFVSISTQNLSSYTQNIWLITQLGQQNMPLFYSQVSKIVYWSEHDLNTYF